MDIAIIGAGRMSEEHIKAFQSFANVKVVGIYSKTNAKSQNLAMRYQIPHIYSSIQDLYSQTNASLVVVAVTETALKDIIEEIISKKWAILLEKPIGLSFDEAKLLKSKIANSKAEQIFVSLNRRFYGSTQQVLQDLRSSPGKRFIKVVDHQSLEIARSYNYSEEILNGWMYKNSIHTIDYFNFLSSSEISDVNVIQPWNRESLNPVIAHLKYVNGDEGLYQGIWHGPGPWSVSVTTAQHYFEMQPLEVASVRTRVDYNPSVYSSCSDDQLFKPGLKKQAHDILNFLRNNKEQNNLVTFDNAFKTMEIVNKIYGR